MARVEIKDTVDGVVHFTLSNKPEHLCKISEEKFRKHVMGKTCWYVHLTRNPSKIRHEGVQEFTAYVRRNLNGGTSHLHREILGIQKILRN